MRKRGWQLNACVFTLLLSLGALIGGCAAPRTQQAQIDPQRRAQEEALQKKLVLERQFRDQSRIDRVAWPILSGASSLCENITPKVGVQFAVAANFNKEYRAAAVELFGLSDRPTLVAVSPGSPAHRAGLKPGDVLHSVGSVEVPTGNKAVEKLHKLLQSQIAADTDTIFVISRNGVEETVRVRPDVICNYPVLLGQGDEINAFADGEKIVIQKGMLRFAETDAELATIIGHELAHNAMGHIDATRTNFALGSLLDIAAAVAGVNTQGAFGNAAAKAYSKEFESEADYVGLYALALADLSIDESANLWRRMAAEANTNVRTQYNSTHPGSADRYLALEAATQEIHSKKLAGEMLQPNLKKPKKEAKRH